MPLSIVPDVFIRQQENDFLIFSPLTAKLSLVNRDILNLYQEYKVAPDTLNSQQLEMLVETGLLSEFVETSEPSEYIFKPTAVTLFPTTDCKLACLYCYASAGDLEIANMDFNLAVHSIDFLVQNALDKDVKKISVAFHGGGEPTHRWSFLKNTIEYAQRKCDENGIEVHTSMSTNGVLSTTQINWIIDNMDEVMLSWDGPSDIQNYNRPIVSGQGSYQFVRRTADRFVEAGFKFGARSTITQLSVNRLEEIFDHFVSIGVKSIHFEPLYECGRCATSNQESPNPQEFVDNYVPLIKKAKDLGIRLYCSLSPFDGIRSAFCGAAGENFCVTPEGYISSCFEVSLLSDPRSDIFFYGHFDKESSTFVIDEDKQKYLADRKIYNLPGCNDCYVKWQCGGECLAKAESADQLYSISPELNMRCNMQQMMLNKKIEALIGGN